MHSILIVYDLTCGFCNPNMNFKEYESRKKNELVDELVVVEIDE
jgi:hypothetical protein